MIAIRQILCPIDFSEFSQHALHHAVALAKWYRASLMLLHVQPILAVPAGPPEMLPTMVLTRDQQQQLLVAMRKLVAEEVGETVLTHVEVLEGNPAREIVDRAKEMSSDLIVMGTHGSSGFEHMLLGSVTERVLRKAFCPVLTVPRQAPDAAPLPPLFKRIVCAVDFSDYSMRALKYATSLAQEADGCLTVMHVFELEGSMPANWRQTLTPASIRNELIALEQERRDKLERAVPPSVNTYCKVETVMTAGTPYKEVLRIAEEKAAELLVIGVHGRSAADLVFFGSTTNHIVRQAKCPVLTVRS
jgi:nucleotide-binding universal stress UspA family protein